MVKKVMVAGSFDIIHLGHIRFLEEAKKICDECFLIVVVARDSTIRKYKGREPVFTERERLEIVKSIRFVDEAILGNELGEKTFFDIISEVKPDIIVLGYDQKVDEEEIVSWCKNRGLNVKVVRLPKFSINGINSSTDARLKILKLFCRSQK